MKELIVGIHQPNFMPWIGFFNKIYRSDTFVLIDDVQYAKGSLCNRTKIKNNMGEGVWLTVPVTLENGSTSTFNQVRIAEEKWHKKALNLIRSSYLKAPYFELYYPEIEKLLSLNYESLARLNIAMINFFCEKFAITTPLQIQSQISASFGKKNYLNLEITQHFGGTTYLSGAGARKYNDPSLFKDAGIDLRYQDFVSQSYKQVNGNFIEGLSVMDLLFNEGENGRIYIMGL